MGEQWKHHQAIIHFYSRDNSHSCCYCRKVLLLFYMWIPGCKSLSQQCLIYCPLSSVSSIAPNNLVSLGLPALFKSTLSTQWEEAVFLPAKAPKIMYRRKEEGEKKNGKTCFIELVLKFPNFFKMLGSFVEEMKRSCIFPKAAYAWDRCLSRINKKKYLSKTNCWG